MSGQKRRQYPKQQYSAYEAPQNASAPPSSGTPAEELEKMNLDQPNPSYPSTSASYVHDQYGVPYGGAPNQYGQQYGGYGQPAYGQPAYGAPQYPAGTQMRGEGNRARPAMALNELYTVDVLAEMPPPVNDLDLPPPPLAVPLEATVAQSPDSNAPPEVFRSTLNVLPKSTTLMRKAKLPLAVVCRPFNLLREIDEAVPQINDLNVTRCRRCRTYINPFVRLMDNNTKWLCSVCNVSNEVPQALEYNEKSNTTNNLFDRPELRYGVVDYLAPQGYVPRPPQPPTYVFLLDVSVGATATQALQQTTRIIRESLDLLPDLDGLTRVAFIGVDSALTFFQLPPLDADEELLEGTAEAAERQEVIRDPRLLVVSDLEDPFLPSNKGLLLNLRDDRQNIENLLVKIADVYASTAQSSSALGSGLKAALKLIANVGGKIVTITSSLPNVGVGRLEARDDAKIMGTKKEHQLFEPQNSFYKSFAVECTRANVSVDMLLMSNSYQDVASLSNVPKFTAGATYYYPGFMGSRAEDVEKLESEMRRFLSQDFGQDGMLRVRASSGMRSGMASGHFFARSSDLVVFPSMPHDQTYVIPMQLEEPISHPYVVLQGALLYTTAYGERKIRVMTTMIPVSDKLTDVYASADQQALATFYAHQANEIVLTKGIKPVHEFLNARIAELFKTYRSDVLNKNNGTSGGLSLSRNLRLLPLLLYALKKCIAVRDSKLIKSDIRSYALDLLLTLPTPLLMKWLYPEFYLLHELPETAGLPDENGQIVLPARTNLSGQFMAAHGLHLIDDGQTMFLWVGSQVTPQLLIDAFGTDDIALVPTGKACMPIVEDSDLNVRIRNIIAAAQGRLDTVHRPTLYILTDRADSALRMWATSLLVEDRAEAEPTYLMYLQQIMAKQSS